MNDISSFCNMTKIQLQYIQDSYVKGKHYKTSYVNNLHHYQINLFYSMIDMQLQELNNRFSEVNT